MWAVNPRNRLGLNQQLAPVDDVGSGRQQSLQPYLGLYPQSLVALEFLHLATTPTMQTTWSSRLLRSGCESPHIVVLTRRHLSIVLNVGRSKRLRSGCDSLHIVVVWRERWSIILNV